VSASAASLRIPAKLNWDLQVLGRREDGYHALRSWFLGVAWYDALTLLPARASEIPAGEDGRLPDPRPEAGERPARLEVVGPCGAGVPADARNLVLRAEDAWRRAGGAAPRVRWLLDKGLPHGAGLGGGSGDAAAALMLLQQVASRALPQGPLHAVAAGLGADVAWFLGARQATLQGGIGDRRLADAPVPTPWVVIAVPDLVVSTPQVYAAYAAATTDRTPATVAQAETTPRAVPGPNDLAAAAGVVEPGLVDFAAALAGHGVFVQTGSGAAHFAACADEGSARALSAAIAPLCEHARAVPVLGGPADLEAERPLLCP